MPQNRVSSPGSAAARRLAALVWPPWGISLPVGRERREGYLGEAASVKPGDAGVLDEGLNQICAAFQPGAKVIRGMGLAGFGQQAAVGPDLLRSGHVRGRV